MKTPHTPRYRVSTHTHLISAGGECQECNWGTGADRDALDEAQQHTRETGHTVRLEMDYYVAVGTLDRILKQNT